MRPKITLKARPKRRNPLRNEKAMEELNPYSVALRKQRKLQEERNKLYKGDFKCAGPLSTKEYGRIKKKAIHIGLNKLHKLTTKKVLHGYNPTDEEVKDSAFDTEGYKNYLLERLPFDYSKKAERKLCTPLYKMKKDDKQSDEK